MEIKLNSTYKLSYDDGEFVCNIKIDKIGLCVFKGCIQPTTINDKVPSEFKNYKKYPIYHGKTNCEWGSLSFTFYFQDRKVEKLTGNNVAIFLDNVQDGHCLWCSGNGVWQISESNYDKDFPPL